MFLPGSLICMQNLLHVFPVLLPDLLRTGNLQSFSKRCYPAEKLWTHSHDNLGGEMFIIKRPHPDVGTRNCTFTSSPLYIPNVFLENAAASIFCCRAASLLAFSRMLMFRILSTR